MDRGTRTKDHRTFLTLGSWIKQRNPGARPVEKCPRCPSLCAVYSDSTPPITGVAGEKVLNLFYPGQVGQLGHYRAPLGFAAPYLDGDA